MHIKFIDSGCFPCKFRFSFCNLTTEILKTLEKCKIYQDNGCKGSPGIRNLMKKIALVAGIWQILSTVGGENNWGTIFLYFLSKTYWIKTVEVGASSLNCHLLSTWLLLIDLKVRVQWPECTYSIETHQLTWCESSTCLIMVVFQYLKHLFTINDLISAWGAY